MLKARIQGVDLSEIVSAAADRAHRQHEGLAIRIIGVHEPTIARADPIFLDRVLSNLLDNAAKADAENGSTHLEVEVLANGNRAVVRVIDHGPGIPWSVHEQLFYPFYQMSERHPRLGAGLGLPICKGFLTLMEGEIWVEETPGGGATFAFDIPLDPSSTTAQPVEAGSAR
jgi:K+-sensing histidine kinase KdpD